MFVRYLTFLSSLRINTQQRGLAALEFAFIFPMLMLLLYGAVEISQYIQAQHKISQTASFLGDNITNQVYTQAEIIQLFGASFNGMYPLSGNNAQIIASCVYNNGSSRKIVWQINNKGASIPTQSSRLGGEGSNPTLPASFTISANESVIFIEIFYQYVPTLSGDYSPLSTQIIYAQSAYLPRVGSMVTPPT